MIWLQRVRALDGYSRTGNIDADRARCSWEIKGTSQCLFLVSLAVTDNGENYLPSRAIVFRSVRSGGGGGGVRTHTRYCTTTLCRHSRAGDLGRLDARAPAVCLTWLNGSVALTNHRVVINIARSRFFSGVNNRSVCAAYCRGFVLRRRLRVFVAARLEHTHFPRPAGMHIRCQWHNKDFSYR